MNTILSATPVLALFDMELGPLIPIIAIIAPFVMIISVTIAKSIARTQQERMRCEVMRAAIERGQPIPAEVLRPLPDEDEDKASRTNSPANDIRNGIICVGVGVGIFVFLSFFSFSVSGIENPFKLRGWQWVGAIPICIGAAMILSSRLTRKSADMHAGSTAPTRRDESGI